jgi:hypothetical protein
MFDVITPEPIERYRARLLVIGVFSKNAVDIQPWWIQILIRVSGQ